MNRSGRARSCALADEALDQFLGLHGLEELIRLAQSADVRILETALQSLVILAEDGACTHQLALAG